MSEVRGEIFNIQRFSVNDGPGIRSTVFFRGCPLSCTWCHNPESWRGAGADGEVNADSVVDTVKRDAMFYEESGGGVTFSGGEPMMQPAFLRHLLQRCKDIDIDTAVDTCGFTAYDDFETVIPFTDLILYDLKLMDDNLHLYHTGVSNKIIHENLAKLAKTGKRIIIRIPLIPGITDSHENIAGIINFISTIKNIRQVSLLPFNEFSKSKYIKLKLNNDLASLKTQSEEELEELKDKFISAGFEVNIRG